VFNACRREHPRYQPYLRCSAAWCGNTGGPSVVRKQLAKLHRNISSMTAPELGTRADARHVRRHAWIRLGAALVLLGALNVLAYLAAGLPLV